MKKQYLKGQNVRLSANFTSKEFECPCKYPECKWVIIDTDHVAKLQAKRDAWQKPVKLNSGHRCEKHNKDVGGATGSRHVKGDASDIVVIGMTPSEVADSCEDFQGLGRYDTFTHVDSRDTKKSRWDFRKQKHD